jgi:hypothetical protein
MNGPSDGDEREGQTAERPPAPRHPISNSIPRRPFFRSLSLPHRPPRRRPPPHRVDLTSLTSLQPYTPLATPIPSVFSLFFACSLSLSSLGALSLSLSPRPIQQSWVAPADWSTAHGAQRLVSVGGESSYSSSSCSVRSWCGQGFLICRVLFFLALLS